MSRMILLTDCVPRRMYANRAPSISARTRNTALLLLPTAGDTTRPTTRPACRRGGRRGSWGAEQTWDDLEGSTTSRFRCSGSTIMYTTAP
jgi:hypothetical protein